MKEIIGGFSAQTNVGVGALAGSACAIMWWVFSLMTAIEVPDAIVAASVVLVTAILQYMIPYRKNKTARLGDQKDA